MTSKPADRPSVLERRFESAEGEVVCRFYRPRFDGQDFRCDYEIVWPDRRRASYAMGVDDVQAMLLAMQKAHADLLTSPERAAGGLTWLGQKGLGLPIADTLRDLADE